MNYSILTNFTDYKLENKSKLDMKDVAEMLEALSLELYIAYEQLIRTRKADYENGKLSKEDLAEMLEADFLCEFDIADYVEENPELFEKEVIEDIVSIQHARADRLQNMLDILEAKL